MIWNSYITSTVIIITGTLSIVYFTQKRKTCSRLLTAPSNSKRNLMTGLGVLLGAGTSCLTIYRWNLPQIVTIPMGMMIGLGWGNLFNQRLPKESIELKDLKDPKSTIIHSNLQVIRRLSSKMDESDEIPFEPLNCSSLADLPIGADEEEMGVSPQSIIILRTPNNIKPVLRVLRRTPRSDSDQNSLNLALQNLCIKNNRN